MHDVAVTRTVHCRVQFRLLPESCRPAYVVRHRGVTLVAIDPRSTRGEVFAWAPCYLFVQERNMLREAYGQPPVGAPMPMAEPFDLPFPVTVPESVRLPGDPVYGAALDGVFI